MGVGRRVLRGQFLNTLRHTEQLERFERSDHGFRLHGTPPLVGHSDQCSLLAP